MPRSIIGEYPTILHPRPLFVLRADVVYIIVDRDQRTATPASSAPITTSTVVAEETNEDDEEDMYENHDEELFRRLRLLNIGTDPYNYERLWPRWDFEPAPPIPLDPMGLIITEWLIIVIGMHTSVFPGYM
ncbi:hypothetical protein PsYK624_169530 [Phanerochaete sordida]|uniref:Uncharacterized protein n=1 Tax=Phanerochaete sordida TaxID=48140 RepID=A0A9P3GSV5_9APHY|nr:hypothetical protein PsYK624_169530 [Phanerochaete sordida]